MAFPGKYPAIPLSALSLALGLFSALLPAPCRAQQPDAPPPAGQAAPAGDSGQRRGFRGNGLVGQIQSVAPGEIKVSTRDGGTTTVHLNAKTTLRIEQQPAKPEDFKPGMLVFVRGEKSADGGWDAESVSARTGPSGPGGGGPPRPGGGPEAMRGEFVAGTVKAIDGTKITLQLQDNSTKTVEVDENTSLRKRRESITLADIHTGDTVIVRGETKNGSFVPSALNVVDPEQLQRMRQSMGPGGPPPSPNPQSPRDPTVPPPGVKPPVEFR